MLLLASAFCTTSKSTAHSLRLWMNYRTFDIGRGSNDVGLQQLGCLWHREYLVSVGLNGHIYYLDRENPNEPRHVIKGHNKFVTALAADVDHGHVYTGSYDSVITRWNIATGASESLSGNGHSNQIQVRISTYPLCANLSSPLFITLLQRLKIAGDTLVSAAMDDSLRFNNINTASYGDAVSTDSPPQDIAVSKHDPSLTVAVTLKVSSSKSDVHFTYKVSLNTERNCSAQWSYCFNSQRQLSAYIYRRFPQ